MLGCMRPNTVLVHGVAVTESAWARILRTRSSLVWCPASNRFLFGRTVAVRGLLDASPDAWQHLALGTDSRLTGSADLLDEMRVATETAAVSADEVMRMVTIAAAGVLKLREGGRIATGSSADLAIISASRDRPADALLHSRRADIHCVTIGGRPVFGTRGFSRVFKARRVGCGVIRLDGEERIADIRLARWIARCPLQEPGVTSSS
jgi:cytosine/adenosine deaminase-related metal-dependent hydrolase